MDNTEMKQVYTVQSQRLDRIEEKLDQMAQAIIALARAEEKISTLAEFNKQQSEQIQSLINRIAYSKYSWLGIFCKLQFILWPF